MGTRSRIAAANADGTFSSIYCHWDGYPSHHGVILRNHYSDPTKVAALIALGDLSSLDKDVGTKHDFDSRVEGMCSAYGRDRGETGIEAVTSADFPALQELTKECGGKYLYVFKGGHWFVAKGGISFFGMPADKLPEFLESIDEVLRQEAQAA